ncbi:MAG: hypothetical protein ACK41P_05260 [Asticcacaulis sp.]
MSAYLQGPVGLLLTVLIALGVLALSVALRFQIGKAAWPYHVGGKDGYLKDLVIEVMTFLPLLLAAIVLRFTVEKGLIVQGSPMLLGLLAVGLVLMLGARRLPVVDAARKRVIEARTKRWDAFAAQSGGEG